MPLPPAQSTACLSVISALTSHRENRRNLSSQFTELPDKDAWPEYYRVIPEPRSLDGIKDALEKGRYNTPHEVWSDLKLVFLNAMHYNEEGSVIWRNAKTLETLLTKTWHNTPMLPRPPSSPSPAPAYAVQPVRIPAVAPTPPRRRRKSPGADEDMTIHHSEERAAEKHALLVQAEHMIRRVEDSMEQWKGYGDMGWMAQPEGDAYKKYAEIVQQIRDYKSEAGDRIAQALDKLPEESNMRYLSYNTQLSLDIIEARIQREQYPTSMEFDRDLTRLFEKGRRYFEPASRDYGDIILLQRMYQQLTAPDAGPSNSGTNFASVPAGPGNAKPIRSSDNPTDGVTTFRISSKERQFTEYAAFKGQTFRVGDYVHLINPDDPAKPIIAQIFKTFVAAGASMEQNQQSIAVCWYYRPEQTVHPAHKHFYVNEVFKTSHFADHSIGDVIEKIGCQFTTKYTRGRPKPPYWYPGWPLYICDSRYNDKEKAFVKIKNWNSCIPDELRKMDFMPVQPFERTIPLRKVPSPFLSGGTGPGKIGEPEAVQLREEEGEREREREAKRRRMIESGGPYGRVAIDPAPWAPTAAQRRQAEDRTVVTAAGGMSALKASGSYVEQLPTETAQLFARDEESDAVLWFSGPPMVQARPRALRHSLAYLHFRATGEKPLTRGGLERAVAMEEEEAEGGERSMVM